MIRAFVLSLALLAPLSLPAAHAQRNQQQAAPALPDGVRVLEKKWYSEQVKVAGRLFLPPGHTVDGSYPAVVVAPGWGKTAASTESYAAALAAEGVIALTVDYRGWGRSGGQVYLGQPVATYDKMRFSEQTPELVIRRGRLDPELQVQDIRNAVTYLQSEAGVDRARIGVMGFDVSGGHVISVMGMDARVKAGAAITPIIGGANEKEESLIPDAQTQAEMIRLAREGAPPRTPQQAKQRNTQEARIALAEYKPFWRLDAIPETSSIGFFVAGADREVDNSLNALAAAKALKAKNVVRTLEGFKHNFTAAETAFAGKMAAQWLKEQLAAIVTDPAAPAPAN